MLDPAGKETQGPILGKNIIGVTSPSPLEAILFKLIDPISWEEEKEAHHFTIHYYLSKPSLSSKTAHTTRGPLVPYFGTQTKPLIAKAYMELKGNPRTNKALQLLSMRETMIKAGSNLDKLLLSLCSNALDIDVNSLPSLQAQEEASAGEGSEEVSKSPCPQLDRTTSTHTSPTRCSSVSGCLSFM